MRRLAGLLLVAAAALGGCGQDSGDALELTVELGCAGAATELDVAVTFAPMAEHVEKRTGPTDLIVIVPPDGTQSVDVTVTALANARTLGSGNTSVSFDGPARKTIALPLTCAGGGDGPSRGDGGAGDALANDGAVADDGGSTCPPGQRDCGGTCTDVSLDVGNCGSCGIPCNGPEQCVSGQCKVPPTWPSQPPSTTNPLTAVWGSSASDVYVVGTASTILHSTGNGAWTVESSGVPTGWNLTGVWGSSASDVYVVGFNPAVAGGIILHTTDKSTWSQLKAVGGPLEAVWGSGPGDVYVVGGAQILHSSDGGATWSAQTSAASPEYYNVWGSSPSDVYVVGGGGIQHSTGGGAWTLEAAFSQEYHGVWGSSAGDVYASGDQGVIVHSTGGGTWTAQLEFFTFDPIGIWGSSATDVYALDGFGALLHSTGTGAWSVVAKADTMRGLWGSSKSDIYLVGGSSAGVIQHGP